VAAARDFLEVAALDVATELVHALARHFPAHLDRDGPIGEGVGELADQGNCFRAPGRELLDLVRVALRPNNERHAAGMPGIEQAAQLFVLPQERVGFVDQQCRLPLLDSPEHGAGDTFAAANALRTSRVSQSSRVDFPHRFSGDTMARIGAASAASIV
jgi:hypothetical protein